MLDENDDDDTNMDKNIFIISKLKLRLMTTQYNKNN
jgi:hypothetical protein